MAAPGSNPIAPAGLDDSLELSASVFDLSASPDSAVTKPGVPELMRKDDSTTELQMNITRALNQSFKLDDNVRDILASVHASSGATTGPGVSPVTSIATSAAISAPTQSTGTDSSYKAELNMEAVKRWDKLTGNHSQSVSNKSAFVSVPGGVRFQAPVQDLSPEEIAMVQSMLDQPASSTLPRDFRQAADALDAKPDTKPATMTTNPTTAGEVDVVNESVEQSPGIQRRPRGYRSKWFEGNVFRDETRHSLDDHSGPPAVIGARPHNPSDVSSDDKEALRKMVAAQTPPAPTSPNTPTGPAGRGKEPDSKGRVRIVIPPTPLSSFASNEDHASTPVTNPKPGGLIKIKVADPVAPPPMLRGVSSPGSMRLTRPVLARQVSQPVELSNSAVIRRKRRQSVLYKEQLGRSRERRMSQEATTPDPTKLKPTSPAGSTGAASSTAGSGAKLQRTQKGLHLSVIQEMMAEAEADEDDAAWESDAEDGENEAHQRHITTSLARDLPIWCVKVTMHEARDLPIADLKTSDPYCRVKVATYEQWTNVVDNTLSPKWNETLTFYCHQDDRATIDIQIYDHDAMSADDHLGSLVVPLLSKAEALSASMSSQVSTWHQEEVQDEYRIPDTWRRVLDRGGNPVRSGGEIRLSATVMTVNHAQRSHLLAAPQDLLCKFPGGHHGHFSLKSLVSRVNRRRFVLGESYLGYSKYRFQAGNLSNTSNLLLYDEHAHVTHRHGDSRGVYINNHQRSLHLRARSGALAKRWSQAVALNIHAFRISVLSANQVDSFSPRRANIDAQWFVNGTRAYGRILAELQGAQKEIFIADWWLSPDIMLTSSGPRLSEVLLERARVGIKVYVLVYREIAAVLNLFSKAAKARLTDLHSNIIVMRHPGRDLQNITNLYWSHHQKIVVVDQSHAFVGGLDLCLGRRCLDNHPCTDDIGSTRKQCFPGFEYVNQNIVKVPPNANPEDDLIDPASGKPLRKLFPRLPWQDVHCYVSGWAARDIARNFIERWNHHRYVMKKRRKTPTLIPDETPIQPGFGTCEVQVIRSISRWSAGVPRERSIYHTYLEALREARSFVYIENQFFISSTSPGIKNAIAHELLECVFTAIEDNRPFRVIVTLPLHPEGNLEKADSSMLSVYHYFYETVNRGDTSMYAEFCKRYPNRRFDDYFSFVYLRSWGQFLTGQVTTEAVYVHSKCLIVDDRIVVIGSANINDRSMMGTRDSEIAVCVRDTKLKNVAWNGEQVQVSEFAHNLRMHIWKSHLGIKDNTPEAEQIVDPISDETYHGLWTRRSRENAHVYLEIFPDLPSDQLETLTEAMDRPNWQGSHGYAAADTAETLRRSIHGFVVRYPFNFLSKEDLSPSGADALAGRSLYT